MPTNLEPLVITPTTHDTLALAELAALTRDHLQFYRLEVGRVILDRFFGGDSAAYLDRSNTKSAKFSDFAKAHATDLEFLGLNERILRSCVQLRTVYLTLPPTARETLGYSRTLALTSVDDATKRAQMAKAAIDHNWTLSQLREAIQDDRAGLWYDTDSEIAGVQPPVKAGEAPAAVKPMAAGHFANRAKRWADDANAVAADWTRVDAAKLSKAQRKLARDALQGAAEAIAGLLAKLDAE